MKIELLKRLGIAQEHVENIVKKAATKGEKELFTSILKDILRNEGVRGQPIEVIHYYEDAVNNTLELVHIIAQREQLNKRQRMTLYRVFIRACITNLEVYEKPVTRPRVILNLKNIRNQVELSFPGYFNSGLLHIIADTKLMEE